MGKGLGLIGNFKGKVGNVVGYHLTDSNNKQTQGVRVYQPVVKNPRTYAQAEQRMRMSVINATYRALKDVIDRGQETKAYGNASRLAWLSRAMKNFEGPYFVKGEQPTYLAPLEISRGSLAPIYLGDSDTGYIRLRGAVVGDAAWQTLGNLCLFIKNSYTSVQDGDQVTIVAVRGTIAYFNSFVIDTTDTTPISWAVAQEGSCTILPAFWGIPDNSYRFDFGALILSREGSNGAHLRSSASLENINDVLVEAPFLDAARRAAILSYMQDGTSTDWPTEQEPVE